MAPRRRVTSECSTSDPGVAVGDPILDASGAEVGTYTSVAAGKALGYVRRGAALTSEV